MTFQDEFGLEVSGGAAGLEPHWNALVRAFLAHSARTPEHLEALLAADPEMPLAQACRGLFCLLLGRRELHATAREALKAIPARELWPRVARTVRVWERIRSRFSAPIEITSAYRPSDYNRTVGGQPESLHVMGAALDFTVEPARREQLVRAALAVFHERGPTDAIGLGVYGYPAVTHIHMDTGREYRVFQQTPRWRQRFPPAGLELPPSGPWTCPPAGTRRSCRPPPWPT